MEKEITTKHVKMIITVCSEENEEDYTDVEMDYYMPSDEWVRLINTGEFSLYYYDVIESYKKYFEKAYKKECCIAFAEIKEPTIAEMAEIIRKIYKEEQNGESSSIEE